MQHRHAAILGGAFALTSFLAVGAGAAASTAAGASGPSGPYGSSAVHASAATTKPVVSAKGATKTATVHTATSTVNGKTETILVDAAGLPLYYYPADTAKKSLVSGELARLWPPLLSAHPTASSTLGKLTALKVAAGHQVTYKGHFLYTFIEDTAGHVTGQGVSNFSVATPQLKAISSAAKVASTAPAASSSGGSYGYGY
jgi:predicted lipoprotein with Yx(FWY)xxD motif